MRIAAVGSALPPHYVDQESLIAALRHLWAGSSHHLARLEIMLTLDAAIRQVEQIADRQSISTPADQVHNAVANPERWCKV